MALLNDRLRGQVTQLFEQQLQRPVTILLFHAEGNPGDDQHVGAVREMIGELSTISGGKVTLREHHVEQEADVAARYGVKESPVLVFLDADGKDQNFRMWGAPLGYEFSTLLEDIVDVSKGSVRFSPAGLAAIQAIDQDVEILVFSTPG